MDKRKSIAAAALSAALAGCVGPAYKRPQVEAPAAFKELPTAQLQWKEAAPKDTLSRGPWWELFGDERLNGLEKRVLSDNQSLKQSEAQYREARAAVTVARSAYFPTVSLGGAGQETFGGTGASASRIILDNFSAFGTATWEPDLWGQVRYSAANAKDTAQSQAALLENVRLSLQTQLASDYFTLEALDLEEAALVDATSSYVEALRLTQARFKDGVASQVDVDQAQSQLSTSRAQTSDVALSRAQFEHAIAVLVGTAPANLSLSTEAVFGAPPPVPTGLPAELLERRPDVAAAERQAAAANANIGLQRTAYFPTITVAGTAGYSSTSLSNLLTWPARFWLYGVSAAETLLDFGRRRGLNKQAEAAYDASAAGYRQTVLSAFQDVEDNLAAIGLLAQEAEQEDAALKAARSALRLENERYRAGVVSYLDVIQSQNIALTAERTAAQVQGRRFAAVASLVRALGGGWDASKLPNP
jgi:NodT family efflux transporter outer membrane factor (OMF) lipoprotein